MRSCNFCSSDSNGEKLILKLKPCMLKALGVKTDLEYYACEDHFDPEATSHGKRRRWANNAKLNVNIENMVVDKNAVKGLAEDHTYARDSSKESECDSNLNAIDLKMGEDYFTDSQSITCVEETVNIPVLDSQVCIISS